MSSSVIAEILAKTSAYGGNEQRSKKFRFWQIEQNLNQTADILERCLSLHTQIRSLEGKWGELSNGVEADTTLNIDETARENATLEFGKEAASIRSAHFGGRTADFAGLISVANRAYNNEGQTTGLWLQLQRCIIDSKDNDNNKVLSEKELSQKIKDKDLFNKISNTKSSIIRSRRNSLDAMDSPINYLRDADSLSELYIHDFEDAYDRLATTALGLDLIYGYKKELPKAPYHTSPLIDSLVWVRDAIREVSVFGQSDQGFTLNISIKNLLANDEWKSLLLGNLCMCDFKVADAYKATTAKYSNIRLRGISGFLHGTTNQTPWQIYVKPPVSALSTQFDSTGKIFSRDIPQDDVPYCLLGRVESRDRARPPEIAGVTSLTNVSPIGKSNAAGGKWAIQVVNPDFTQEPEDIQIELQLVGQVL